jgi:hypothetical protein
MWTYRCYDDGDGGCPWQRWYDANPDYQGSHDAIFDVLETQDVWNYPAVEFLDKVNRIIEVRLHGRVKHRVLGFYGSVRREFIVLGFCYHKQKVYYPQDIKATVVRRKRAIEQDATHAKPCRRPR